MPAKLKLTCALVDQIVELKRDGLCDAGIIAAIGMHQATFYRWLKEVENAKTGVKRALYGELKRPRRSTRDACSRPLSRLRNPGRSTGRRLPGCSSTRPRRPTTCRCG